jgi:hypothetical protein
VQSRKKPHIADNNEHSRRSEFHVPTRTTVSNIHARNAEKRIIELLALPVKNTVPELPFLLLPA